MLHWETRSEKNVQFHAVERSVDGISWQEIGQENGLANSTVPAQYNLEDRAPLPKAYYRLRSVDFNGQENRSGTIVLTRPDEQFGSTRVFPSPTEGNVTVQFSAVQEATVVIRITDMTGRMVLE